MNLSHFFIDRPIFATVISIFILIVGGLAYSQLPVSQYPEIAPPTVVVRANYPGADAETVSRTVATPIEEEVNGVENMLYMSSYSTADGAMSLTITFALGTDLDQAQVLVQNRVAIAEPRLPEESRRLGITTLKSSPDLMMVVHMLSPDNTYDQLYISNFARDRVRDELVRLPGVGDLTIFGERRFAMRIWLNPDQLSSYGMTASDVVEALQEQNIQVSGGNIGAPPEPTDNAFQYTVTTQGRFDDAREFRYVIVKATEAGRLVRLQDVARVELGAQDYITNSYLNNQPAVALGIFQRPGTNALGTAEEIIATMERLSKDFPPGVEYRIVYNPTDFIAESVNEVYKTIFEAMLLVVIVVIVFLQSWRTALIPIIAIPVSLIGAFAIMAAFGYSLNLLTLFGLVLAIGIVVDDAIVVVENVERNIDDGMEPREAAHKTMDEVGSAVLAITIVLIAVFVPTAFIPGISGQFYQQFAVTIAAATALSGMNSLTLSPALAAIFLRSRHEEKKPRGIGRIGATLARAFNFVFDRLARAYAAIVRVIVGYTLMLIVMILVFCGLLFATGYLLDVTPQGFIPEQDQGYAIVVVKLPDGASLSRTDAITRRASDIVTSTPGIASAVAFAGFSGATFTNQTDSAAIFATFKPFEERIAAGQTGPSIIGALFGRMQAIEDAFIIAVPPPSVRGIGQQGGFKLQIQDRDSAEVDRVMGVAYAAMGAAAKNPGLKGVYTTYSASSPSLFLDIERDKARMLNVPIPNIFDALSSNFGTAYVNDFNIFGRVFQVRAQADTPYRAAENDILRLKVRSATGALVPLGTVVSIRQEAGPQLVQRYNMLVSVPVQGGAAPGVSTGTALDEMEKVVREVSPPGTTFEWTELAFQQRNTGDTAIYIFGLAVLFAFLAMAALYESWVLPIAIILIVPLSILAALIGVNIRGLDNNILTQVGLVVLVGLAAKNAILIVEFAKQGEDAGKSLVDATVDACRLRLRPILMTAFAFILGVVPLVVAKGPGAEMRISLGTAVFSGMLGVTFFGLFFTPVFYVALRRLTGRRRKAEPATAPAAAGPDPLPAE